MATRTSFVRPSPIKLQITNTAVGFTLIALVSTVVFLIANAIAVGLTATNFPTPVIKTIALTGLEEGPARVYIDVEFPGTSKGNLISAQTDGPLKVSVFVSENGKALPSNPSLFVEIPNGINLNLASRTASSLVIDDLQIQFGNDFNAAILSKLITAKIENSLLKKEQLPNVQIKVETRVVFKSLWIPLGFSINYPHNLNLDSLLPPPAQVTAVTSESVVVPVDKTPSPKAAPKTTLTEYEKKKQEIIKNFDFKPRSVKILASDSEKLEIIAVAALPAIMIPEFLTVEVPTISLKANFFEVGLTTVKESRVFGMLEVRIEPFLLQTAPPNDLSKEIQVKVSLLIDKHDVQGLTRILELARDDKMKNIGIQIELGKSEKRVGGLMHWLKDFVVEIPLKEFIKKDEVKSEVGDKNVKGQDKTEDVQEIITADNNNEQFSSAKNQIASFKFLGTEKLSHGGSFIFQVKVLRSIAAFFIGKLPELDFEAEIEHKELINSEQTDKTTYLFGIKVSSNEVTEASEALEINFRFEIENLKDFIYTGIRLGKLGSKEYHELVPEIGTIRTLKINSKSNNLISKLAAIFDIEVLINDNGLEQVKFQNSERVLFPVAEKAKSTKKKDSNSKTPNASAPVIAKKKQMELATKFTINNGLDLLNKRNVNIAALIEMAEIPYFGDFVSASWESFALKLNSGEGQTILQFQISQGAVNLGITGGAKPISINFATGITIPAEEADLNRLSTFLKSFLESEKDIMDLKFEIYSGSDSDNSFVLESSIPCKKLLLDVTKDVAVITETAGTTETSTETTPSDATTSTASDTTSPLEGPTKSAENSNPKREDFIGKIQNSILSFVSFQASTWLFHVTYPDGQYCQAQELFDLKLKIDISLPMIEANVCSKPRIDSSLNCFASAGISRPMKFSIDIVDGSICHVESVVLPQEAHASLSGLSTIQHTTNVQYENNEIPIHISIRDFTQLVLFGEWAASKKRQYITVGPVKDGSGFNNLVGVIVSSVFYKEIPEPASEISENRKPEIKKAPSSVAPILTKKIISFNPDEPAILQFQGYSANENNLEILIGFDLPSNTFKGIRIAKVNENRFEWPVLQWGMFEYNFGVKDVFDFSLSMTRGQVDVQDDLTGIVPSLLKDFGLRIKLTTNQEHKLGSTALRQVFGTFKSYFLNPEVNKENLLEKYFKGHLGKEFFYKFVMNGPRGLNDPNVFFAKGMVPLRDLVAVGDAIFNRPKHPDDLVLAAVSSVEKKETDPGKAEKIESTDENLFSNAKITMKTIERDQLSPIEFPCLIPALCEYSVGSSTPPKSVQENPFDLVFQVENMLQPATQLIARHMGTVFEKMKMAHYPSHFRIKYTADTDIWVTLMLNGAGIVSVGLKPFEFDRTAFISYNKETTIDFIPAGVDPSIVNSNGRDPIVDMFDLKLSVKFPNTITGLRSMFGIFRRESMLMPPITPVSLRAEESDNVKLTNPPVVIALSSDDPFETARGKNLLSALVAALIPETVLSGINPSDELLASFYDPIESPEILAAVKTEPKKTDDGSKMEMGKLDYSKIPKIGLCLLIGKYCETQMDVNYNVMMPFAVSILKLILPSTSIVRFYVDNAPVIQIVADAKKQRKLQVSSETGLDILGTANICFSGLKQVSAVTTANVYKYIWGAAVLIPIKFQVILGHDVDITANLHFPFYTTKDIAMKKFKDVAWSLIPTLAKTALSLVFPSANTPVPKFPSDASPFFLNSRPERKVCRDTMPADKIKERVDNIDYSRTVLFFEEKSMNIKPGKPFNAHFQLRTKNDLVVCGLPTGITSKIRGTFVYETEKSFVNLINLISYEKPTDQYKESFSADYDSATNLFSIKDVKLKHTGRYSVRLIAEKKINIIADTVVYVTHEY